MAGPGILDAIRGQRNEHRCLEWPPPAEEDGITIARFVVSATSIAAPIPTPRWKLPSIAQSEEHASEGGVSLLGRARDAAARRALRVG
jgi:hypothetical protein